MKRSTKIAIPFWIALAAALYQSQWAVPNILRTHTGTVFVEAEADPQYQSPSDFEIAVPASNPYSILGRSYGEYLDGYLAAQKHSRWNADFFG